MKHRNTETDKERLSAQEAPTDPVRTVDSDVSAVDQHPVRLLRGGGGCALILEGDKSKSTRAGRVVSLHHHLDVHQAAEPLKDA
jgi:hypothetical protein